MSEMISHELKKQIIKFFLSLDILKKETGRRSFTYAASLDDSLRYHINYEGTDAQFIPLFIEELEKYGTLIGRKISALEASLETAKEHFGENGQKECANLIEKLRKTRMDDAIEKHEYTQCLNRGKQSEGVNAIQCFEEAYDKLPAYIELLKSFERKGIEEEREKQKEHIITFIFVNAEKLEKCNIEDALDGYRKILKIDDSYTRAILNIANIYYRNVKTYHEAAKKYIECYIRELKVNKVEREYAQQVLEKIQEIKNYWRNREAYEELSILYENLYNRLSIVSKLNNEISDQIKEILEDLCRIGDIFLEKERFTKAKSFYEKARKFGDDHQQTIYKIVKCYINEGQNQKAEDLLIDYIRSGSVKYGFEDIGKIEAFILLLDIETRYLDQNAVNNGINIFRKLLTIRNTPTIKNIDSYIDQAFGGVLDKLENYEAISVAKQIRHYTKFHAFSYYEKASIKLADLYSKFGYLDDAIKIYKEIVSPYEKTLKIYSQPMEDEIYKQRAIEIYSALLTDIYQKFLRDDDQTV